MPSSHPAKNRCGTTWIIPRGVGDLRAQSGAGGDGKKGRACCQLSLMVISAAAGCGLEQEPQAEAVQPNPRDLPPEFASRCQRWQVDAGRTLQHSSSQAPSCGGKTAFYPHFAEGAGQGQGQVGSLGLGASAAPSSGAQHCPPLLAQTSLASRCVHTTN